MVSKRTKPDYVKIAPSILSADFANLGSEISSVSNAGADFIHLDVMDGSFVKNLSFGPPVIRSIRGFTGLPFDVHLMVSEPEKMLNNFAEAGANFITVHAESCLHLDRVLNTIRLIGCKAGIALNPHTPETIINYVIDRIDLILVMTVNPGYGGQKLIMPVLEKISKIRDLVSDRQVEISVDGGVSDLTVPLLVEAGASVLVAGSAVFKGGSTNYAKNIKKLREAARFKKGKYDYDSCI